VETGLGDVHITALTALAALDRGRAAALTATVTIWTPPMPRSTADSSEEQESVGAVAEVDEQVAGLLGNPGVAEVSVGWVVIPAMCTRRRPCSTITST
jgi:hypothetical protein